MKNVDANRDALRRSTVILTVLVGLPLVGKPRHGDKRRPYNFDQARAGCPRYVAAYT